MARTVLFSNSELANYINANFEPVWQSVREVPVVNIDFGNGHSIKRTINGNVATYVCQSNGQILDVLPGLYEPKSYKDRLEQLCLLNEYINNPVADEHKEIALARYHQMQYQRLEHGQKPARFVAAKDKGGKEKIQLSAFASDPVDKWSELISPEQGYRSSPPPRELSQWEQLMNDVRFNETELRKKIHARLSTQGAQKYTPTVSMISRWIYRDVLHADIDDPYLGLQTVLDGTYPFDLVKSQSGGGS